MKKKKWSLVWTVFLALGLSVGATKAQVNISVNIAPPALVSYNQPMCPGDGYMWIPGYWAYSPETGYYWIPGYWTMPPEPGLYWTPGYWGMTNGLYVWNRGYWGPQVGFYGGINYGYGYFGTGYVGGRWNNKTFVYNTAVTNINRTVIRNVYVDNNFKPSSNRVSYNGKGGIATRPTSSQRTYMTQQHYQATPEQRMQHQAAMGNTSLHYENNGGRVPQENIDHQGQNYQNFRQQHQSEPEFKSPGRAVPTMRGGRGGGRR